MKTTTALDINRQRRVCRPRLLLVWGPALAVLRQGSSVPLSSHARNLFYAGFHPQVQYASHAPQTEGHSHGEIAPVARFQFLS